MTPIKVFRMYDDAALPTRATEQSACYDIQACIVDGMRIDTYGSYNEYLSRPVSGNRFDVYPGERALIPTGLVFDIPSGYSLRIHPRSGLSLKKGITLANSEGVVDSDYTHQTFVSMINNSDVTFTLEHGDRIAQVELMPVLHVQFEETNQTVMPKTDRAGGFGSTGLNT